MVNSSKHLLTRFGVCTFHLFFLYPVAKASNCAKMSVMKKIFLFFMAAVSSAFLMSSCSNEERDFVELEPCGILLPVSQEYLDKGLTMDSYGTDMAVYPVTIIGFTYPKAVQEVYAQASLEPLDADDPYAQEKFYRELKEKISVHQKLICEIAVIPSEEYESLLKNPLEGLSFISDMKVIAKKYGNTYLVSNIENTFEGMSDEELEAYRDCERHVMDAVKKAKFKKIEIKKFNPDDYADFARSDDMKIPMFASLDVDGNSVTEQIFNRAKMTVLLFWNQRDEKSASFAGEFSSWTQLLPDGVQALGIICDINSPTESDRIEASRKTTGNLFDGNLFTNIIAAGELQSLGESFGNLPAVVLVDESGSVCGRPIENANLEDCIEMLSLWMETGTEPNHSVSLDN